MNVKDNTKGTNREVVEGRSEKYLWRYTYLDVLAAPNWGE